MVPWQSSTRVSAPKKTAAIATSSEGFFGAPSGAQLDCFAALAMTRKVLSLFVFLLHPFPDSPLPNLQSLFARESLEPSPNDRDHQERANRNAP